MIELTFIRHADAGDPRPGRATTTSGPCRPRASGRRTGSGAFLAGVGFAPDAIVTSPKLRALQTAQIVAERIGKPVSIDDRLAGAVELETLETLLRDEGDPERPVVVGHDPDFSDARRGAVRRVGAPAAQGRPGAGRHRAAVACRRPGRCAGSSRRTCSSPPADWGFGLTKRDVVRVVIGRDLVVFGERERDRVRRQATWASASKRSRPSSDTSMSDVSPRTVRSAATRATPGPHIIRGRPARRR